MKRVQILIAFCFFIIFFSGCGVGLIFSGFSNGSKAIKNYYFNGYSKNEVYEGVKKFRILYPEYFASKEDLGNEIPHYGNNLKDPFISLINSDSVAIHFKFTSGNTENILIWLQVAGANDNWYRNDQKYPIRLALLGICEKNSGWMGYESYPPPDRKEKKIINAYVKEFENLILPKLRQQIEIHN